LAKLAEEFRMQNIVVETARDIFDQMQPTWNGSREFLMAQSIRLMERFMTSGRIRITVVVQSRRRSPANFHHAEHERGCSAHVTFLRSL